MITIKERLAIYFKFKNNIAIIYSLQTWKHRLSHLRLDFKKLRKENFQESLAGGLPGLIMLSSASLFLSVQLSVLSNIFFSFFSVST